MQKRKSHLSAFLYVIIIPVVFIIILIDKPDYNFFNFIHKITVPVAETIGQGVSYPVRLIGRIAEKIRMRRENLKENEEIAAKLTAFEKTGLENQILKQEIELLKNKLKITENIKQETIVANIIHNNSFMGRQSFIIENPSRAVSVGNMVLSNTGHLLGVISENIGSYAKVQSIRDINSNIPVRIAGTDIFGFLYGGGNSDPELRFLSNGDFVPEPGMFLITSGVNGNVPSDIPVGRIDRVSDREIKVKIGAELGKQESAIILLFERNQRYE